MPINLNFSPNFASEKTVFTDEENLFTLLPMVTQGLNSRETLERVTGIDHNKPYLMQVKMGLMPNSTNKAKRFSSEKVAEITEKMQNADFQVKGYTWLLEKAENQETVIGYEAEKSAYVNRIREILAELQG